MTHANVLGRGRPLLLLLCLFLAAAATVFAQELTITTSSEQARDLYWKATAALEQQRTDDALPIFKQAIQADPGFALAYLGKAMTDPARAQRIADLQKAAELASNATEGERLVVEATQAFFNGDAGSLKTTLDQLVSKFPGDKHVLLNAAGLAMNPLGDNQKALDLATKATTIDPKFGPAFNLVGYAQLGLGNMEAAEAALKTYAQVTPDEPNPHDSYAELLLNMGRYDESIQQYTEALKIDPKFQSAILGIGHDYIFKGDFARARESYQKLIENGVTPAQKASGYEFLAASYLYEGKTGEAVKALEARQKLSEEAGTPGLATSYQMAGYVLTEAGRAGEGVKYFKKADDVLKISKLSQADRDMVEANGGPLEAYALAVAGQTKAAEARLARVKTLIEKRGQPMEVMNLHTAAGLVAAAQGNVDEAIAQFAQGDPNNPVNTYHQALALEKKGEVPKAVALYTRVSKSNVNNLGLASVRKMATQHVEGVQAGAGKMK